MLKVAAVLGSILMLCLVAVVQPGDAAAQQMIRIGGLTLDDPSDFNDLGREKVIAYAISEFNAEQAALNSDYRIEYTKIPVTFNEAGLPHEEQQIYQKVREAYQGGIKYFVGPSASSLALTAKAFTDTTPDAVLISPSSTAPALAIPDDSLFRLIHDDTALAPELANFIAGDGKEHVIIVQREDVWGEGLYNAISATYGGNEVLITMAPAGEAAATGQYYADIATQVRSEVEARTLQHGAENVAVLLILFEADVHNLVGAVLGTGSADGDVLGKVKWYGTDGFTGHPNLLASEPVADFLATVRLVGIIFQVGENPINQQLNEHIIQFGGLDFTFRDSVYDATYLLADSVIAAGELSTASQTVLTRDVVWDVANGNVGHPYHSTERVLGDGALGMYALNPAGDLSEPITYALLKIVKVTEGSHDWIPVSASTCR